MELKSAGKVKKYAKRALLVISILMIIVEGVLLILE